MKTRLIILAVTCFGFVACIVLYDQFVYENREPYSGSFVLADDPSVYLRFLACDRATTNANDSRLEALYRLYRTDADILLAPIRKEQSETLPSFEIFKSGGGVVLQIYGSKSLKNLQFLPEIASAPP